MRITPTVESRNPWPRVAVSPQYIAEPPDIETTLKNIPYQAHFLPPSLIVHDLFDQRLTTVTVLRVGGLSTLA
jgi:hypothetical protein